LGLKKTVHEAYDHIVAILIVGLIFVGAVLVLPTISFSNIQAVDQQQLKNTALNVFNAILLDTGEPSNWSSIDPWDTEAINRFGLARFEDSTFYVLDPEKVQRLVKGNPLGEINQEDINRILNLEDYGFSLRIVPPFNVTNLDGTKMNQTNSPINKTALAQKKLQYSLKVTHLDGRPVPNAVSSATIVNTNETAFEIRTLGPVLTNSLGILEDSAELNVANSDIMVILRISVSDVATLIVTFGNKAIDHIADINLIDDTVILTRPDIEGYSEEERRILAGYAYSSDGTIISFFEGPRTGPDVAKFNYGSFRLWEQTFGGLGSYDPVILVFNIWARPDPTGGGKTECIVAGLYQKLLGYNIFEYETSHSVGKGSITLQRSVIISGMTYTAELVFWKESN
jgi:type II secretory pathway pseudopilin PulG